MTHSWCEEIRMFWNENLPILISVKNGYAFLSIEDNGAVAFGREPEYEETIWVADSFSEFVADAIAGKLPREVREACQL